MRSSSLPSHFWISVKRHTTCFLHSQTMWHESGEKSTLYGKSLTNGKRESKGARQKHFHFFVPLVDTLNYSNPCKKITHAGRTNLLNNLLCLSAARWVTSTITHCISLVCIFPCLTTIFPPYHCPKLALLQYRVSITISAWALLSKEPRLRHEVDGGCVIKNADKVKLGEFY